MVEIGSFYKLKINQSIAAFFTFPAAAREIYIGCAGFLKGVVNEVQKSFIVLKKRV